MNSLQNTVISALKKVNFLEKEGNHFNYTLELNNYNSGSLPDYMLKNVFNSSHPLEAFWKIFDDDVDPFYYVDIYKSIFDDLDLDQSFKDNNYSEIMDIIRNKVETYLDYSYYLNQLVPMEIYFLARQPDIATTDLAWWDEDGDYYYNLAYPLKNFFKSQGYTEKQFIEYSKNRDGSNDIFDTVIDWFEDGSIMGAIVFWGMVRLEDILFAIEDKKSIIIPQTAFGGIAMDEGEGQDLLKIKLKKPIKGTIGKDLTYRYPLNEYSKSTFRFYEKDFQKTTLKIV